MKIYTINMLKGRIEDIMVHDKEIKETNVKSFDPITIDNYEDKHPYFTFSKKNIIKKWDIYNIIEEIGKNDPGTLMEFSIYSHAYYEGPILVDSLSDDRANDNDFRRNDVMSIDKSFSKAFHEDGKITIWGCSFPIVLNLLFSRLRKNPNYTLSFIEDDKIFKYAPSHFYQQNLIETINAHLKTKFKIEDSIKLSFKEIKKIAAYQYLGTYAAKFAETFELKVVAALPATYSLINPKFHISPDVMNNVNFYKHHLNVELEDNYGIYNKDTVERLTTYIKPDK